MVKLEKNEKKIYEIPFKKFLILQGKKINVSRLILTDKYIRIQYYTHIYVKRLKKVFEQILINIDSVLLKDSYPEIYYEERYKKIILTICFDDEQLDIGIKYKKKKRKCINELKNFIKKTCEVIEENLDKKISTIEPEINIIKINRIKTFLLSLGESKTELNNRNIKKIRVLYPIPLEHKIIWADCTFNKKCLGIVFTQKGIFIKKLIDLSKNDETKFRYIKWDYVDDSFFDTYLDKMDLKELEIPLSNSFTKIEKSDETTFEINYFAYENKTNNKIEKGYEFIEKHKHQATKHGYYAEEANNFEDILNGKNAVVVGGNNKKKWARS